VAGGSDGWHRVSKRRGSALARFCAACCAVATTTCSDATDRSDCGSVYGGDTSLTTWWRAGVSEEGQAQQSLVDGYLKCSRGEVTVEAAPEDKEATLRVYEDQDRHLLLVNGLTDIDRLECTAQRGSGLFALQDMDSLRWNDRIPDFLQPYVRPCLGERTNRLFAIPVGLHTLNRTLIHKNFEQQFASGEVTLDGFVEALAQAADQLQAKPIVLPDNIERSYLLIENLMVAVAGEQYTKFWDLDRRTQAESDIDMTPFMDTLNYTDRLLPYIEFVGGDDPLLATMERVCSGKAALTVQADWVDPANYCDDQLVAAPFPGTAQYNVFSFDAFAVDYSDTAATSDSGRFLPEQAPEYAWLKAVTSAKVQAEYAQLKRSKALVKADAAGNTVAVDAPELFGSDVEPLPGLLLVVEHTTFKAFGAQIAAYLDTPVTDAAALAQRKTELTTYVHGELCKATSCKPIHPVF
jgi:hypothetical protein